MHPHDRVVGLAILGVAFVRPIAAAVRAEPRYARPVISAVIAAAVPRRRRSRRGRRPPSGTRRGWRSPYPAAGTRARCRRSARSYSSTARRSSCARNITSTACSNKSTSNVRSGRRNFMRFSDARLQAESSTCMYSEHGLDALIRPEFGGVPLVDRGVVLDPRVRAAPGGLGDLAHQLPAPGSGRRSARRSRGPSVATPRRSRPPA